MEAYQDALLWYLGAVADNPNSPPDLKQQAIYIITSFRRYENVHRLIAQITALIRNELTVPAFQRVRNVPRYPAPPVRRFGRNVHMVTATFGIIPTTADFEGHPIELISILDPNIEELMEDNTRVRFHQTLLAMEKRANEDLAVCTQRYGYHYVFRAGLQQYYMTKSVVNMCNFWRTDPRGDVYRVHAQRICYAAIERRIRLNALEKLVLIHRIGSQPQDALRFWNWLERNRVAYIAMRACIAVLHHLIARS